MPSFRVGTYYTSNGDRFPVKSRVSAYTLWYSTEWKGCIEYTVNACSGAEAKKYAIHNRLQYECTKWHEQPASLSARKATRA